MIARCMTVLAFVLAGLTVPTQLLAEEPLQPLQHGVTSQEFTSSGEPLTDKRPRPDFDGVEDKTTVGEALLWAPRVALFPLYLVSEFVIRKPLGWAITNAEKHYLIPKFTYYTTFGEEEGTAPTGGVKPIFRIDSGTRFAFGLLFYVDRMFAPQHSLRLGVDSDFDRNLTVELQEQTLLGERLTITPKLRYEQRDDFRFHGIGADTEQDDEKRFYRSKSFASVEIARQAPFPGFGASLDAEVSDNQFRCNEDDDEDDEDEPDDDDDEDICGTDSQPTAFLGAQTPAFVEGYQLFRTSLKLSVDSRRPRPASSTGVRAEAFGRWGQSFDNEHHFIRTGGELAAFWDIFQQRVIGVRVYAEHTLRSSDDLPFSELILLGGSELMRGFARGRFHGETALVASLDYRYPVWSFVDGTIFAEAGNVFANGEQIEPEAMRGSFGIGLRSVTSRRVSFDALIGLGTTRFDDDDFGIDSARVTLGTNWGF